MCAMGTNQAVMGSGLGVRVEPPPSILQARPYRPIVLAHLTAL